MICLNDVAFAIFYRNDANELFFSTSRIELKIARPDANRRSRKSISISANDISIDAQSFDDHAQNLDEPFQPKSSVGSGLV